MRPRAGKRHSDRAKEHPCLFVKSRWERVAKEKGEHMGRMCEEKKRYETESEAIRMGLAYTRHSGGGIRVYLCPICKGWHLTTHAEDGTSLKNEFAKL